MKLLRVLVATVASIVVAGTIASATPGIHGPKPPAAAAVTSPRPSESPDPSDSPEPSETPEPSDADDASRAQEGGEAPDFSVCEGLRGLDNAICRHEALLDVRPDDRGLHRALGRLRANAEKHADQTHGQSDEPHGQSGEPHGNGNGHAG